MFRLAATAAVVVVLALPATVAAQVTVDGCSVFLTNPNATSVVITEPGYDPVEFTSEAVEILPGSGFGSGDYVATWDDGLVEPFTIACDEDPVASASPEPPPAPAPHPTDRPSPRATRPPVVPPIAIALPRARPSQFAE